MEALVDADAVALVRARRWMFAPADSGRKGEVRTPDPAENLRLHYVVMGMTADYRNLHLGHRNDDPLDCRRANLVVRTLTDSAAHKRKQATANGRPCTSRFKGVCWLRREERWLAAITKDRRQTRLGTFSDELAAAQAYDEAVITVGVAVAVDRVLVHLFLLRRRMAAHAYICGSNMGCSRARVRSVRPRSGTGGRPVARDPFIRFQRVTPRLQSGVVQLSLDAFCQ
jgi:hypothetical protein